MSTTTTHPARPTKHQPTRATSRHAHNGPWRRRKARRRWAGWAIAGAVTLVAVGAVLIGGRTNPRTAAGAAPTFVLASTSGQQVSLADFRGKNVLLFFNEGVGCDSCFYQMSKLESDSAFDSTGVELLPVVMNTASQTQTELRRFSIRTPYLLDADGAVSRAYGTLGTGHHANLPGHTFVLIGKDGQVRWRGDYPNMFVEPSELIANVTRNLG